MIHYAESFFLHTSSTPQGGGESFQDQRPIGNLDGVDAWLPERPADRMTPGLELLPTVNLSVYLSTCLSIYDKQQMLVDSMTKPKIKPTLIRHVMKEGQ